MRKLLSISMGLLLSLSALSQAAYLQPVPTNVNLPAKIFVDLSQPDCNCPNLQDASALDPIYLWSWFPSEPVLGNGAWDSSNEDMVMTQDENNPNLWFIEVVITEFYGVDEATAYSNGMGYLVKKKDGLSGGSNETENKSNDFNYSLIAPPCEDKVCPHPQVFQEEDYFTLFYNIQQEINSNFHPDSLAADEELPLVAGDISLHIKVITDLNNIFQNASQTEVYSLPNSDFHLSWDETQQLFFYTFIPEDLFELSEGEYITEIQATFIKNINPSGLMPSMWRTEKETFYPGCN
jgi:hypothetical protein